MAFQRFVEAGYPRVPGLFVPGGRLGFCHQARPHQAFLLLVKVGQKCLELPVDIPDSNR